MRSVWLMYHDVGPDGSALDVPRSAASYHVSGRSFEGHLATVVASGLDVVRASDAARGPTSDSVVLTFDDGWLGTFETAVPLVLEHGLRATIYITKDFVGRKGFCSEAALVEAAGAGIEIGVHGATHRMLSGLRRDEILEEFRSCKEYLEFLVQREVTAASCPGGDWSAAIADCARDVGLTSLCTSRPGVNTRHTSPLELRRIAIRPSTSPRDVDRFCRFAVAREVARWAALQAPRRMLGMQRYARVRRWIMGERSSAGQLFDP